MTLKARPHTPNSEGELFLHPAPDGKVWLVREEPDCAPVVLLIFWRENGVLYVEKHGCFVPADGPNSTHTCRDADAIQKLSDEAKRWQVMYREEHTECERLRKILEDEVSVSAARLRAFYGAAGPLVEYCRKRMNERKPRGWGYADTANGLTNEHVDAAIAAFDAVKDGGK